MSLPPPSLGQQWVQIVLNEILAVTTTIRRTTRWDMSVGLNNGSFLSNVVFKFTEVRRIVSQSQARTIDEVGIMIVIEPFLDVVKSGNVTGPIMGSALSALEKFLNYQLIHSEQSGIADVMVELAQTVTHCRFEATDTVADEVVLMKILHVLKACLVSPAGYALTDEAVAGILVTCFSMCFQTRLSELLRRSAEQTLNSMVQVLLSRLADIAAASDSSEDDNEPVLQLNKLAKLVGRGLQTLPIADGRNSPATPMQQSTPPTPSVSTSASTDGTNPTASLPAAGISSSDRLASGSSLETLAVSKGSSDERPHGLPAIHQLLVFLVSLLDPNDRHNTDTTRSTGLSILMIAIENGGMSFHRFPLLMALVKNDLCRHLFAIVNSRESQNTTLLAQSLRTTTLLFSCLGTHLRCHQEYFLNIVFKKLSDEARSVLPEHKELFLESLKQLAFSSPYFFVDLYVNYDCEIHATNVFDKLVRVLSAMSSTEQAQLNRLNLLAFEVVSHIFQSMADRCELKAYTLPAGGAPSVEELQNRKTRKRQVHIGVEKFNASYKEGLKFLSDNALIQNLEDHEEVAKFLRTTPTVSKKMLGRYLGERENVPVLDKFMHTFDFTGKRIDEALRVMVEAFRLPGEAQQIDRVVSSFAEWYMTTSPAQIADKDAAYVFSYSIIMLNTDLYNKNNKHRRMTLNDFIRNNSGINNKKDFDKQFLEEVYNSIAKREIVMPEEQEGQVGDDYAWKQLVRFDSMSGPLLHSSSSVYDREMFMSLWQPVLNCISQLLGLDLDDSVLQSILTTLKNMSTIAGHYRLTEALETMLNVVIKLSTLLETQPSPSYLAASSAPFEKIPSRFAQQPRYRLASQTAFALVRQHGSVLRNEGWLMVMKCFKSLYKEALLPDALLEIEDFAGTKRKLPLARETKPPARKEAPSLFSSITQYFLEYETVPELDTTSPMYKSTREFIAECRVEDVFTDSRFLQEEALDSLLNAAIVSSFEEGSKTDSLKIDEDPAVFFFEAMVRIILQNRDRSLPLLQKLHVFLATIFEPTPTNGTPSSTQAPFVLVERATIGLLNLSIRLSHNDEVMNQLFESLSLLCKLNVSRLAPQIAAGLTVLLKNSSLTYSPSHWRTLLHLVSSVSEHNQSAVVAFAGLDYAILSKEESWLNASTFGDFTDTLLLAVAHASKEEASGANAASTPLGWPSRSNASSSGSLPVTAASSSSSSATTAGTAAAATAVGGSSNAPLVLPNGCLATDEEITSPKNRALRSLDLLWLMFERARTQFDADVKRKKADGTLSAEAAAQEFFKTFWLPVLSGLASNSSHPQRQIRIRALTILHQVLMIPELDLLQNQELWQCFNEVLFPLLEDLLSPDPFLRDPMGAEETRLRASSLLGKLFLQSLKKLCVRDDFTFLWLRVLDFINKYMHAEQSSVLAEQVSENLTNLLLVMASWGVLVDPAQNSSMPPGSPSVSPARRSEIWQITWDKINNFMPHLQAILFPPNQAEEPHYHEQQQRQPQQPQPQTVFVLDTPASSVAAE